MITTEQVPVTASRTKRVPGQPDMWFFVLFESLIFTAYFGVYLFNRAQHEHDRHSRVTPQAEQRQHDRNADEQQVDGIERVLAQDSQVLQPSITANY